MRYFDAPHHLQVQFDAKDCQIPPDELSRMQRSLAPLSEAVKEFAMSELWITCICHPRSQTFHVEGKLKMPGRTVITGDRDTHLDTAFQRCVQKMVRRIEAYEERPNREAMDLVKRQEELDRNLLAPEDPSVGPLGEAVQAGDYRRFRHGLSSYDEWLQSRVGQWLARYPELQTRVRDGAALDDCVEEVYLNAFEHYPHWPTEVRFHEWLEGLISPSLEALLRDPEAEKENVRFAESVREMSSS